MSTTSLSRRRSTSRSHLDSSDDRRAQRALTDRATSLSGAMERVNRAGQIALGLIWLIDGVLQFQPYMFGRTFVTGVLLPNASGQPALIASLITWIGHQIEPHVVLFNAFAATLQVAIGIGLLVRRTVRPALLVSFVWAAGIWVTGEGLGGFLNDTANALTGAPGAVLLYVLVGLMVWPRGATRWLPVRVGDFGLAGRHAARLAFAVLWGSFAVLWLLPANDSADAVRDAIGSAPTGASWLTSLLDHLARASAGHGTLIAVVLFGLSATIAIGVLCEWRERTCLAVSAVIALAFWVCQGFGGVFTGQATDVNTGPLLVLIAALLYGATTARRASHVPLGAGERDAPVAEG